MPPRLCILILSGGLALAAALDLRAQEAIEPPSTLQSIGSGVWAAIDNPQAKARAAANAGFVVGDDGVVVVDTLASADAARHLLSAIRKVTTLPVRFVVNSHYHLDHVAGNQVFVDEGAVVIAHRHVREWIHPENLKFLNEKTPPALRKMIEGLTPPTVGYDHSVDLYLGRRVVRVVSYPGHTGGDSVVLVPDARVVFGGDLVWRHTLPNTIDATTKDWMATLDTLANSHEGWTFVPGHGRVATSQDVLAFRDYLSTLQRLVREARATQKSGDALMEAVMPELAKRFAGWDYFKLLAPMNIREADAELAGTKRLPRARPPG